VFRDKISFKSASLSLAVLLFPFEAWSVPNISSLSQAIVSQGQSVTASGNGFGVKTKAAPLRFETWGKNNAGKTAQEASSGWWRDGANTLWPRVTSQNTRIPGQDVLDASIHPSTHSLSEGSESRTFYKDNAGFAETHKSYLNFWLYTDFSDSPLNENINTQLKFIHMPTQVLAAWPWGYASYVLPSRNMSFWENDAPQNSQIMVSVYTPKPVTLNGTVFRNDLASSVNIFKSQGWYNIQMQLDQGTAGVENGGEKLCIVGPGYSKYGVWKTLNKSVVPVSPSWVAGQGTSPSAVWYDGKRYAARSNSIKDPNVPPDQNTDDWHEVRSSDYIDAVAFWFWSQKRGNNHWTPTGSYKAGAKVDYSTKAYVCTGDVLSTVTPDMDPGHWSKVFDYPWPSSTIKLHLDSMYIDNSFARVEIGDKPVYDNCAHREIQIPTAWSDGSVTFSVNKGSFPQGAQAYLYIVDEGDNVNANGYPLSFAASASAAAPAKPRNLRVK